MDRKEQRKIFSQLKKKKEDELKLKTVEKYPEIHKLFIDGEITITQAYNHCMSEILNVEGYKSKGTKGFVTSSKIESKKEDKLPYYKNPFSSDDTINLTFDELNQMDFHQFKEYIFKVRTSLKDVWEKKHIPPTNGKTKEEIIEDLKSLKSKSFSEIEVESKDVNYRYIIDSNYRDGSSCNQFFPQLYRVKTKNYSLWDLLSDSDNELVWLRTMVRNFKCDYLYQFTKRFDYKDEVQSVDLDTYGLIIHHADNISELTHTKEELEELRDTGILKDFHLNNISSDFKIYKFFEIRYYKKDTKVFNKLIHTLRISFNNQPTNFSPIISKFLFDKYLPENRESVVYDPCSGFGGRLLGSLMSKNKIHYIGTDVNSSLFEPVNSYETLGGFVKNNIGCENTFSVEKRSSDEMDNSTELNKYKGKVDMVLTSPPYFSKEMYSSDKEQSYIKYPNYKSWIEGYLFKTFKIVHDNLKVGGYCFINISDVNINKRELSLEIDTIRILEQIGFKYEYQIGMTMNRFIGLDTELIINRWFDYNTDKYKKVEPILVFRK